MLLNSILAAEGATGNNNWIMWVIIGVVLVLMIVLTIVPQKKRQKEQQKMMDSLNVGTKVMTVGGIVGKITQVNSDNTLIVNVGTEFNPTLIVIDRKAVGYVLEAVAAPAVAPAEPAVEDSSDTVVVDPVDVDPVVVDPVTVDEVETVDADDVAEESNEDSAVDDLNDPFGR